MSIAFAVVTLLATIGLVGVLAAPILRARSRTERVLADAHRELASLAAARSAGRIDAAQFDAQRSAVGESLLALVDVAPRRMAPRLYTIVLIAMAAPLAAFLGNQWVQRHSSSPAHAAMGGTAMPLVNHDDNMQAAIAGLARKLAEHPDDAQGWALLGRTYKTTGRYAEARDAFRHAVAAAPGDAGLEREYANAETPDPADPVDTSEPQESPVPQTPLAESVLAASLLGAPARRLAAEQSPHVTVKVTIDPAIEGGVAANDSVFVFAKAVDGPAMPLAVTRLNVGQLPAEVSFTNATAMTPGMTLSRFPQIIVGARVSKSGDPAARRGDYETRSAAFSNTRTEAVTLTIRDALR